MDSGSSGSMQSSSGGEEYDSRPESLPAFLNPSSHFGPLSANPQHQPSLFNHHQQPTLFDPSPNLFHAFSQSPANPNPSTPLLNLDVVRPRGLRSDPDCTDHNSNLLGSSASSSQSILGAQGSNQAPLPSMQLRAVQDNGARSSSPSDPTHVVARNPKKRTRASRRAPTTVLTTDTSNFRAMVQEFTGIPAPPFSGSPYSRRLDLFGIVGSSMSLLIFPSLNIPGLGAKSQASMPLLSLEELGMSHGQINVNLSGLPSHETAEGMRLRNDGVRSNNSGNQDHLRCFDNCKLNYSTPSSDFHHDKGLENVPPRGEGTVDSWICPSE
ncbi:hypothetical protein GH714_002233 [Hevea brasiliensis]|uniref:VQ domain-containing protein n=1 Tax=Hevea brasiliensis TaxID=3981 RepID=A0A6A6LI23_HEVBR|nr:hypothetical protein GH714_002233 [Hevea brasiliensis]